MRKILISVCAFQIAFCLFGMQSAFSQSVNKYLGQIPPQGTVKRFPPDNLQMLAVNGVWMWHGSPTFSPDLKEMFFVKYMEQVDRAEIWYSHLVNNAWSIPVPAPFGKQTFIENSPAYSPNGDTLYFYSQRLDGPGINFTVRQADGSWSVAQHLMTVPNMGWNLTIANNKNLYFELATNPVDGDVYRCRWVNGQYLLPERLPDQVNSTSGEGCAFIDPDEEYLIFMSKRPGGSGLHDLYISFSKRDGGWTQSVNLGTWINSNQEDGFPRVSPDGKYLFFNTAKASSADQGYNPYWVSASFIDQMRPIEPDTSNRLIFCSDRDGNAEIYSMFQDGSVLKRLTNNLYTDIDPTWSNDGKKIAFISDAGGNFELYTMNSDGSNIQKITETGLQLGKPDWSTDGSKILFTVSEDAFSDEGKIGSVGSDGSGYQLFSAAGEGSGPVWTNDGSAIIFCSRRTGHSEIYMFETDGNNLLQITRSETDKMDARLSPDGSRIAYTLLSTDGSDSEIHLINANGTGDIQLTLAGKVSKSPSWAADGTSIFFQTGRFGNQEIYQMDDNGKYQTNISRNAKNDFSPKIIRKSIATEIPDQGWILNQCELKNIWPNPVKDFAQFEFFLPKSGKVGLVITDMLGRRAVKLLDQGFSEGNHQVKADLTNLSPGIYTITLSSTDNISVRRFVKN